MVNTSLLSEYTFVDERVKTFLLCIKAWAKLNHVSSAAHNGISSYAWVNLGIFYLQCVGFVPNLQCREFMKQHGFHLDPEANWLHCVNDLETGYLPWSNVAEQEVWKQPGVFSDTPVTLLLYGFFHFYAKHFPRTLYAVSIREGDVKLPRATFEKSVLSCICIEDPFETCYSHTPHDLGKPADENGQAVIFNRLCESEQYLRCVLEGKEHSENDSFWRLSAVAQRPQVTQLPNGQVVKHSHPPRYVGKQHQLHRGAEQNEPIHHKQHPGKVERSNGGPKPQQYPQKQGRGGGRGRGRGRGRNNDALSPKQESRYTPKNQQGRGGGRGRGKRQQLRAKDGDSAGLQKSGDTLQKLKVVKSDA